MMKTPGAAPRQRRWVGWAAALLCCLGVPALSIAADLGGRVIGRGTEGGLSAVEVRLVGPGALPVGADPVTTDDEGGFLWRDLAQGEYLLRFARPGFRPDSLAVALTSSDRLDLVIALEFEAFALEEIVVVGRVTDVEADLQTGYVNLDRQTLSSIPGIIENDPLRALQILPGVQAASDISSGLYIRGGGPDQTLVLMEGVTVYNPTHAFGFFSTFNNDAVRDLALYKGAYPAAYGGRLGAVLDVDLVRETEPGFGGRVGLSLIAGRLFLSGRNGDDSWWAAGRRSFLEPLLRAVSTDENPIPSWYFYDTNFGYTTRRGGGMTRLLFYKGRDQVDVTADADTGIDLGWGNTVVLLQHERFLNDDLEGRVTLSHSRYLSSSEAEVLATGFSVRNRVRDTSLAGRLDWRAGEDHRLLGGASYAWYDFNYRQEFNQTTSLDFGTRPAELALFLEDNWFVGEYSTVRAGLRHRRLTAGHRSLWEPRLALSRDLGSRVRLKLGGGLYHQDLQLVSTEGFSSGDFYVPIDDTAEPGRSWQAVAGAEWQATARTQASLEVYNTGLENLVALDNTVPVDQGSLAADDLFVTEGKGYARGVEVFVRHEQPKWSAWFGYTLGWAGRTFAELNGGAEFVPKYDRRHDLNLLLTRRTGAWQLSVAFRYATGQAFTPAAARYQLGNPATGEIDDEGQILSGARNSARLLPYHRVDVSARRPIRLFGLAGEFVAEVFNVYNRRNEWFVQYETKEDVTEATVVRMLPLIPSVGVDFAF